MTSHYALYKHVCWQLLRTELIELRKTFFDQAINLAIWVFCTIVVVGYITKSQFNIVNPDFGVFNLAGCVATAGFFEVYPRSFNFIADLEGPEIISYYTTLPLPAWLVFVTKMIYWFISSVLRGLIVLPLGKLILWDSFSLSAIHWPKFALIFILSNVFYSCLTLLVSSIIPKMSLMENVWMRVIFPLWFLGGFQFSWFMLFKLAPAVGYLDLLNPIIYVMEAMRVAMLGPQDNLPFWLCILMLTLFSIACALTGIKRLKKRLDCV